MSVKDEKILMSEVAILYYENKYTQQEIADVLKLSRQTVSKLLNDAIKQKIVEFKIHNPQKDCEELEQKLCEKFCVKRCIVVGVSAQNELLRTSMTVKSAAEYIISLGEKGDKKIAISWGRTVQNLINTLPKISSKGNVVFPLFGATDNENLYFSSNELARSLADKIGADVKYAWFPYMAESNNECELLKKLSHFRKMQELWDTADISVVGIGNTEIIEVFGKTFGYGEKHFEAIGDIATHFFNENGEIINLYENTLCASADNIRNAHETIAVACGDNKAAAISGALRTGLIDTLITDEFTAKKILER